MIDKKVKIGIVVDDYKLMKYKVALKKNGFSNFKIFSFVDNTTSIKIKAKAIDIGQINEICKELEAHFVAIKN